MSTGLKGVNVAVLFVEDLDGAKRFYRETIGFEPAFEDDSSIAFNTGGAMLILLNLDGAIDLLTSDTVAGERPAGVRSQLVSFVDDVDAVYTDLLSKGVEFVRTPETRPWGMRTAHFTDPEGNVWEIAQEVGTSQPSQ
jgi:lactoylglutathione lyase